VRILNSRRVVGGPFLTATGAVALAVCLGATITFALVPRVGAGFAFGGTRTRKSLIGFSDEVTLSTSGFLSSDDETVALRAIMPRLLRLASDRDREAELDHFYWRGTVYDTYSQGRWLRSRREVLRSQITETDGPLLVSEPHMRPIAERSPSLVGTDRQEIDIVGVSAPVAFALDHPVAFEIPPPKFGTLPEIRLVARWSGEVAFQTLSTDGPPSDVPGEQRMLTGAHYTAYSRDPFAMTAAVTGRPLAQIPREIIAPYLTLSPTLSPRVITLAREITLGRPTAAAKVVAIIDWLERTHEYSGDLGRRAGSSDPVENFLFEQKTGHCEYFASAAAMLLRAVGVPTRYVNGFLGGEWNAVGQYVTVRQNRAHAWVEAYLGELGWMRVDATPPVRAPGRMGKVRQLLDSMEFFWSRWVVGYDLGRQLDLARNFGRGVGVAPAPSTNSDAGRWPWKRLSAIGLGAIGILVGFVVQRRRRRTNAPGGVTPALAQQAVGRLYRRCLERLVERGTQRRPSETPREFADRVLSMGLDGADAFQRLTELYLAARFGRKEIKDQIVGELAKQLGRLGLPAHGADLSRAA
jgi:transglutaminase-like putative cysteine protease